MAKTETKTKMTEYHSNGDSSSVEFLAAIGLMLDLDRNQQVYHSWRVALVSYHLARRVGSFESPLAFLAGLLADCGAIRFMRHIVYELIEVPAVMGQKSQTNLFFHPIVGSEAVQRIPGMRRVAQLIKHHHECYNGSGYPAGLAGDDIDQVSQVLRLADQLDLTIRADQPGSAEEVLQTLYTFANEDYSRQLLEVLEGLLENELSFGNLLQPEKINQEVEGICASLSGLKLFESDQEWDSALEVVGEMIDFRNDLFTQGHSARVTALAERIARYMELDDETRRSIRWTACLQNMGEVALRRSVLSKSGKLEEEERKLIRQHPIIGCNLIASISKLVDVARNIRYHHENWDGSGYPEGLVMTEIPLASRIIRVADSFDAMCSERTYQKKREWKHAVKELKRHSGKQFDPQVVDAAIHVFD